MGNKKSIWKGIVRNPLPFPYKIERKNKMDKIIETPDLTVARLTDRNKVAWNSDNPVYFDGMIYWEVNENGIINEIEIS
jgi:hypothetical protein